MMEVTFVELGDMRWSTGDMSGWRRDDTIPPRWAGAKLGEMKFYRKERK